MTDLTITLTGEIRESNFEEWKNGLVERIRAVDIDLSEDDDFAAANDGVRQFREAEQTLKAAKQAALEQAADINRLFDAVDAATEETRQARLALERKIRARRHELRQRELEAHAEANAAALDALPVEQRALFQDRAALLALPAEELEATIEHRVGVWRAVAEEAAGRRGSGGGEDAGDADASPFVDVVEDAREVPRGDADETAEDDADGARPDAGADGDAVREWRVTIELSAPRAKAEQLFTRVRDRWKADKAVRGIDLSSG